MPYSSEVQEAAVESLELDAFATKIEDLIYEGKTLYNLFKQKANKVPIANITAAGGNSRPAFRIPFRVQEGSAISQGTGNGDSLGRGTGSNWAAFALSPVFTYGVNEITFLAQIATEGKKRGLFQVKAQELRNSLTTYEKGLEALCQGDGSGTLDTIPAGAAIVTGATGSIQVSVATQFQDQQVCTIYIGEGGSVRGTLTISYVDTVANVVYGNVPAGTVAGDVIAINGSNGSNVAGNSILGLKYWQLNGNVGTVGGLSRSAYPGRLSTPTINLSNAAITQGTGLRANIQMGRALGEDNSLNDGACWYTGPDQGFAISNIYLNVMQDQAWARKGNAYPDEAKRMFPEQFAGRDLHVGYNATPGRLDLFNPESWYMGELLPVQLYDFGSGMTVVPVPDIPSSPSGSGSYLTSHMFSYVSAFQIGNANVRAGCYITGAGQPQI